MRPNPLAAVDLDRCAERRTDLAWLQAAADHRQTRFFLTHQGRLLAKATAEALELTWLESSQLTHSWQEFPYAAFLGLRGEQAVFVVDVDDAGAELVAEQHQSEWVGARRLALQGRLNDAGVAAYGRALSLWQRNHQFCGRCGAATEVDQAGFRRRCTQADCRQQHFPRLDPAVIVAVGFEGRCLLGRQPSWPPNRYSTLAGFVEPGESLEDAVVREVAEESGVIIEHSRYHSSQPWPFPSSLMLGFLATAKSAELALGEELDDAKWLNAEELKAAVSGGTVILPPPLSISHRLLCDWYRQHYDVDIQTWQAKSAWR